MTFQPSVRGTFLAGLFSLGLFVLHSSVNLASAPSQHLRPKRSPLEDVLAGRTKSCKLLIGIDEPLYEKYDRNMTVLIDLAQEHVDGLNGIFAKQVFTDGYSELRFHLGRIQVMFGSCDGFQDQNCTELRSEYLKTFDRYDFTDFCLAYMFTYLDFHNGTAGLATIGTACRSTGNSGFVTFLNYGLDRSENDSILTFAHEVGHSFGAYHDDEEDLKFSDSEAFSFSDEEITECTSDGYIMKDFYNGTELGEFSKCSLKMMHNTLEDIDASSNPECFEDWSESFETVVSLCGDGVVDPGEECDCGPDPESCNDACCYPAHISEEDRFANRTAMPCARNQKTDCLYPPGLVYGVYVPFVFIIAMVIIVGVILNLDWKRDKKMFKHVTQGNIRIV